MIDVIHVSSMISAPDVQREKITNVVFNCRSLTQFEIGFEG